MSSHLSSSSFGHPQWGVPKGVPTSSSSLRSSPPSVVSFTSSTLTSTSPTTTPPVPPCSASLYASLSSSAVTLSSTSALGCCSCAPGPLLRSSSSSHSTSSEPLAQLFSGSTASQSPAPPHQLWKSRAVCPPPSAPSSATEHSHFFPNPSPASSSSVTSTSQAHPEHHQDQGSFDNEEVHPSFAEGFPLLLRGPLCLSSPPPPLSSSPLSPVWSAGCEPRITPSSYPTSKERLAPQLLPPPPPPPIPPPPAPTSGSASVGSLGSSLRTTSYLPHAAGVSASAPPLHGVGLLSSPANLRGCPPYPSSSLATPATTTTTALQLLVCGQRLAILAIPSELVERGQGLTSAQVSTALAQAEAMAQQSSTATPPALAAAFAPGQPSSMDNPATTHEITSSQDLLGWCESCAGSAPKSFCGEQQGTTTSSSTGVVAAVVEASALVHAASPAVVGPVGSTALDGLEGSRFPTFEAGRCEHRKFWKRLRAKRGFTYFICLHCGLK